MYVVSGGQEHKNRGTDLPNRGVEKQSDIGTREKKNRKTEKKVPEEQKKRGTEEKRYREAEV